MKSTLGKSFPGLILPYLGFFEGDRILQSYVSLDSGEEVTANKVLIYQLVFHCIKHKAN